MSVQISEKLFWLNFERNLLFCCIKYTFKIGSIACCFPHDSILRFYSTYDFENEIYARVQYRVLQYLTAFEKEKYKTKQNCLLLLQDKYTCAKIMQKAMKFIFCSSIV